MNPMKLVIVAGLPGTGKSSIAEVLAKKHNTPLFTKDWLEATLRYVTLGNQAIVSSSKTISEDGYEFMTMLAMRQLKLGQSVILEGVIQKESLRKKWRALATEYGANWHAIECVCT